MIYMLAFLARALARTPGGKIAAIKAYRLQTGAGLKKAKEAVERMEGN